MTAKPFAAIRPDPRYAPKVHVPPYDVVERADVIRMSDGNPNSFFQVTRADAWMPDADEHSPEVYEQGGKNLRRMLADRILIREDRPAYYVLSQTWKGRTQTGVYGAVSCDEYESGLIKKHELTRQDKEEDRTRHILGVGAGTGPVFLAFNGDREYGALVAGVTGGVPEYDVTDENGTRNRLWVVKDETTAGSLGRYFESVPSFYIADGHHRAASAVNVRRLLRERPRPDRSATLADYFMAVIFPAGQLNILPYNRVVTDLNGLPEDEFLKKAESRFSVERTARSDPERKGEIILILPRQNFLLVPKAGTYATDNPLDSLDVSILQKNLLGPVLGIDDPRTSSRIRFVGGIRGNAELARRVRSGEAAAAFSMHPVSMADLMAVTDRGECMPPKSTWFEPKLRDGLVTYPIW